jgi:steroid 5-alpha reductase family enzyme
MLTNILIQTFLLIFAIQVAFFAAAYVLKTDKFTDFAYGTTFIAVALYVLLKTHPVAEIPPTKIILLIITTLWGLRLAIYLFIRIIKTKKDGRFDQIRNSFLKFGGFWLLQAVTIWVISLPTIVLMSTHNTTTDLTAGALAGLIVWATGFTIEAISDHQKFSFLNKPENKGKFLKHGLWTYSRHPNYFGEILCWTGVFIYATSLLGPGYLYIIASPVYIAILLIFVSGIPPAEQRMDQKFGDDPDYQSYKHNTNILVPWFKR